MATSTPVRSNNFISVVIGIGAVIGILVILGNAMSDGSGLFGRPDPEGIPPGEGERNIQVTFETRWGQIVDTGETFEDTGRPKLRYECVQRDLNITIWVDGEQYNMDARESDADPDNEPCTFRHHMVVGEGAELRMLVEEVGGGGWKMCQIHLHGIIALPNGWAIARSGDDCEVWAVAL